MRFCLPTVAAALTSASTSIQNEYWFDVTNLVRQELSDTHLTLPSRVNSVACSLTKSYMLIGFWPVSLNTSSVIRS